MGNQLREFWRPILDIFDPFSYLWGNQIDSLFVERPDSPYLRIQSILISDLPQKILVTGQTGCGKTSEMAKLAREAEKDFFVIWLDVRRSLDMFNVSHVEIIFAIGAAVYYVAREKKIKISEKLIDSLVESLSTVVREVTRKDDFKLDAGTILKNLATGILTRVGVPMMSLEPLSAPFSLGLGEATISRQEVKPKISEILKQVNEIIKETREKAKKPLLLIVDGLDRIEIDQAKLIFAQSYLLVQLPGNVIYTAPALLYYSPYLQSARALFKTIEFPNVKLRERANESKGLCEEGREIMMEVIRKRCSYAHPNSTMDETIAPDAAELLVEMSGGVMRELIQLFHEAVLTALLNKSKRIDRGIAEKAVSAIRRKYAAGLREPSTQVEVLRKVLSSHQIPEGDVGDQLLQNLYVLGYINDDIWYDVHPIVKPLISK